MKSLSKPKPKVFKSKPFHCNKCVLKFSLKGQLKAHNERIHLKLTPFHCGECNSKFYSKYELIRHNNCVHLNLKLFPCETCGKTLATITGLKNHHKRIHSELKVKPFSCKECDLNFFTDVELRGHNDRVHLKLKASFKCDECESIFFTNKERKRHHERVHLKLKFDCNECDSNFGSKGDLRRHHKSVHLRLKPYKCDFGGCEQTSATKCDLKKHKKTHTPEGQIRRKKQEDRVNKLLKKWGYTVDVETTIKAKSSNCLVDTNRYFSRVDFHVVNCTNMILLLECDEDQHIWYNLSCEFSRMSDVRASLVKAGYTVPIYWIRYNPNGKFHVDDEQVKTRRPEREIELKKHLEKVCSPNFIPENQVNIHYMYYDLISKEGGPEIMLDDDFPEALKECVSWI